jgi:hypothetical protein
LSFSKQDEDELYTFVLQVVGPKGSFGWINIDGGIDIIDDWLTSASGAGF